MFLIRSHLILPYVGGWGGGGVPDALHLTMIMEDAMKAKDCPGAECQPGPGNRSSFHLY